MIKLKNKIFLLWALANYISIVIIAYAGSIFLNVGRYTDFLLCLIVMILLKIYILQILKLPRELKRNFIKNGKDL